MRNRLLLGPVLIAALIAMLWLDERLAGSAAPAALAGTIGWRTWPPGVLIFPIVLFIQWLGAAELAAIIRAKGAAVSTGLLRLCAISGFVVAAVAPGLGEPSTAIAVVTSTAAAVLAVSMAYHLRNRSPQGVIAAVGGALIAYVYLGVMSGFLLELRREHSAWMLLYLLLVIKACDTGAYFTGKAIGRHKLIPWLSPGKTWEGLAGGMVWSGVIGAVGIVLMQRAGVAPLPSPLAGATAGIAFAVLGQAGDLMASALKRDAGIKDSGSILPGFGGVLDVIDSPLLVLPVAFWWLRWTAPTLI